ncbi:hypothetical protein CLOSTMETH_02309 [[Clostridium] methylpentosum DSM 5476]|uniref:Uncharacterized protein n=1 Tax=[Clostridium] methylpentosum DSM 5476 TaxID=537013 RepID=C0EEM0_9FIRM|nr:hypothetical protein CLOSTMETH_02309 [[Clostridium] methylpentosum DSM 5476]
MVLYNETKEVLPIIESFGQGLPIRVYQREVNSMQCLRRRTGERQFAEKLR